MRAIAGDSDVKWSIRDEDGNFVSWTKEMGLLWRWKDELPERRLACAGRHVARGAASLVAPRLLAPLYALTGRPGRADDFRDAELTHLQLELAEAVLEAGPVSAPELRRLLGTGETKLVNKAIEQLQRELVLTNAGLVEQEQGWPSIAQDVLARRWKGQLRSLPAPDDARRTLAGVVLDHAREVSAADVGAVFRWRRKEAAAVLDELDAESRDEDGVRVWASRARSARAGRTRRTRGTPSSGTR